MYHSVTFMDAGCIGASDEEDTSSGEKNTWEHWRLVPSSRPVFAPPEQKVKTVDIPGGDGLIDLSQALTGYPVYQNRKGSMEFVVMNDFKPWQTAYSDILDYLHGQKLRAFLEDDPEYFYEGRFTVNEWKSEKDWSRIVLDYDVGPYKWRRQSSIDDWLWDPFNFQNGVIYPALFKDIAVGETPLDVAARPYVFGRAPVCPVFHVTTSMGWGVNVQFVNKQLGIDKTTLVHDGTEQVPEFLLFGRQGASFRFWCGRGTGQVSIEFRTGRL